jgi:hypothetical protein
MVKTRSITSIQQHLQSYATSLHKTREQAQRKVDVTTGVLKVPDEKYHLQVTVPAKRRQSGRRLKLADRPKAGLRRYYLPPAIDL